MQFNSTQYKLAIKSCYLITITYIKFISISVCVYVCSHNFKLYISGQLERLFVFGMWVCDQFCPISNEMHSVKKFRIHISMRCYFMVSNWYWTYYIIKYKMQFCCCWIFHSLQFRAFYNRFFFLNSYGNLAIFYTRTEKYRIYTWIHIDYKWCGSGNWQFLPLFYCCCWWCWCCYCCYCVVWMSTNLFSNINFRIV